MTQLLCGAVSSQNSRKRMYVTGSVPMHFYERKDNFISFVSSVTLGLPFSGCETADKLLNLYVHTYIYNIST